MKTLSWPLIFACFYYKQPISKVMSKSRKRELVRVRQVVEYLLYHSGMTYEQIAELMGNHWETVRFNIRQIKRFIEPINGKIQDLKLRNDIKLLTQAI